MCLSFCSLARPTAPARIPLRQFKQVMRLTGHKSGVFHFCFSPDGRRAATVSKDATWRLHDME